MSRPTVEVGLPAARRWNYPLGPSDEAEGEFAAREAAFDINEKIIARVEELMAPIIDRYRMAQDRGTEKLKEGTITQKMYDDLQDAILNRLSNEQEKAKKQAMQELGAFGRLKRRGSFFGGKTRKRKHKKRARKHKTHKRK